MCLFKKQSYPSWKINKYGYPEAKKKKTPANNWALYNSAIYEASKEGSSYIVNVYKDGQGIKSTKVKV